MPTYLPVSATEELVQACFLIFKVLLRLFRLIRKSIKRECASLLGAGDLQWGLNVLWPGINHTKDLRKLQICMTYSLLGKKPI